VGHVDRRQEEAVILSGVLCREGPALSEVEGICASGGGLDRCFAPLRMTVFEWRTGYESCDFRTLSPARTEYSQSIR